MMKVESNVGSLIKMKDGVIIQTDNDALAAYKKKKQKNKMMNNYENDITIIRQELSEIKELLIKLVR